MTEKEYLNSLTGVYSLSQFGKECELLNIELTGVLTEQNITDLFIIYSSIYSFLIL